MTPDRAEIEKIAEDMVIEFSTDMTACPSEIELECLRDSILEALTAQAEKHEAEKEALQKRVEEQEKERIRIQEGFVRPLSNENQNLQEQIQSLEAKAGELQRKLEASRLVQETLDKEGSVNLAVRMLDYRDANTALETLLSKMREALEDIKQDNCHTLDFNQECVKGCEDIDRFPCIKARADEVLSLTPSTIKDEIQSLRTHAEQMVDLLHIFIATCGCGNHIDHNDADRAEEAIATYRQAFPEK